MGKHLNWTLCTVIDEASRYPSRSAFHKGASGAYRYALRAGLIDHLFPDAADKLKKAIRTANKYTAKNGSARGFGIAHPAEYQMLVRAGYYVNGKPKPESVIAAEKRLAEALLNK